MIKKNRMLLFVVIFILVLQSLVVAAPSTGASSSDSSSGSNDGNSATLTWRVQNTPQVNEVKVAHSANGNFVVVWEDEANEDIWYRLYNEKGEKIYGGTLASVCNNGKQTNPDVAMAEDGRFVIVWDTDASEAKETSSDCGDVYLEIPVGERDQDELGSFKRYTDYDRNQEIAMRIFDVDGKPKDSVDGVSDASGEFVANGDDFQGTGIENIEDTKDVSPSVAIVDGKIMVAWASFRDGGKGVYARFFDLETGEVRNADYSSYEKYSYWCDEDYSSYEYGIARNCLGAMIDSDEIPVASVQEGLKKGFVDLAAEKIDGENVFAAVWVTEDDDKKRVSMKMLDANGKALIDFTEISDTDYKDNPNPKIDISKKDKIVVAWEDDGNEVLRYRAFEGASGGEELLEVHSSPKKVPSIGDWVHLTDIADPHVGGQGKMMLAFAEYSGTPNLSAPYSSDPEHKTFGRFKIYDSNKDTWSSSVTYETTSGSKAFWPALGVGSDDSYVLAYVDTDKSENDFVVKRFDLSGDFTPSTEDGLKGGEIVPDVPSDAQSKPVLPPTDDDDSDAAFTGVLVCSDGVDNDGDGYVDSDDVGCVESNSLTEYNRCGDAWDNDNDGRTDYAGGCDDDDDGFIDFFCGCDSNGNGRLSMREIGFVEGKADCPNQWGCIYHPRNPLSDGTTKIVNKCLSKNKRLYLPDPECSSFGDDEERDGTVVSYILSPGIQLTRSPIVKLFSFIFVSSF